MAISRKKEQESVEAVLEVYDNGRIRAPCVGLCFIDYNLPLYTALSVAERPTMPSTSANNLSEKLHGGKKHRLGGAQEEPVTTSNVLEQTVRAWITVSARTQTDMNLGVRLQSWMRDRQYFETQCSRTLE
jgi:hypothetical protein